MTVTRVNIQDPKPIDTSDAQFDGLLSDLQGNILKSNGRDFARHLFVKFKPDSASKARQWIQIFSAQVTSAQEQLSQHKRASMALRTFSGGIERTGGDLFINILISADGYAFLAETTKKELGSKLPADSSFRNGLKHPDTQARLNDPATAQWESPFKNTLHIAIFLAHQDEKALIQATNFILGKLAPIAEFTHVEEGRNLRGANGPIEHFGYADGASQPLFLKDMVDKSATDQKGSQSWDPSAPLSLVLTQDPNGNSENSFGTYVVYRKLEQDVEGFLRKEQELAKKLTISPDLAGAMAVGRFRDGTPLTLFSASNAPKPIPINFDYKADADGAKCPFHAHIRKTNPRFDSVALGATPDAERGHRIVRRAIPYGARGTKPVGLLFICLQSDIGNQFEFMQQQWANSLDFANPTKTPGLDSVVGQGPQQAGGQAWPRAWGDKSKGDERFDFSKFVTMKGGEYFFMPSISFLKRIDAKLAPSLGVTSDAKPSAPRLRSRL